LNLANPKFILGICGEKVSKFMPGLDLNEQFFHEIVQPLLAAEFPTLRYSAARLGSGSDVLGYDTPMSTDHDWGIRMQLFLSEKDCEEVGTAVYQTLRHQLPLYFRGYSVHFGPVGSDGSQVLVEKYEGPVNHRIQVTTIDDFFQPYMGIDPSQELSPFDWLTIPQQLLLGVTKGRIFSDGLDKLEPIRSKFAYFPHDVWLYLLACQWARIGQEEHFVGRTGLLQDEIGSRLLASRLVHDLMLLGFLMEKQYAPYPKWFGTAFAELDCAAALLPELEGVMAADTWQAREQHLCVAYEQMAEGHNALGITPPLRTKCVPFHERPFQVINAEDFTNAILKTIKDASIRQISTKIGSIDQFSHSTDLRSDLELHRRLVELYQSQ